MSALVREKREGGSRHRFGHAQKLMAVRQAFNRLIIFIIIAVIIVAITILSLSSTI